MFRRTIAPALIAAAGIAAAVMRTVCLNNYFEPGIGLFRESSLATALAVLSFAVAAFALGYGLFGPRLRWREEGMSFEGGRLLILASGLLIFLSGLYFFFLSTVTFKASGIMNGALACVWVIALLGLARRTPEKEGSLTQILLILSVFWGCLWLLTEYRSETINPEVGMFIYRVLDIICAVIMLFETAACRIRNGRTSRLIAASWGVVYFSIIVLFADLPYFAPGFLEASNFGGFATYAYTAGVFLFALGVIMSVPGRKKGGVDGSGE